jgi:hypothetical protein
MSGREREILEAIGRQGRTRDQLGELADAPELQELIRGGLVTYEPIELRETVGPGEQRSGHDRTDVWYLTPAGADAVGITGHLRGA